MGVSNNALSNDKIPSALCNTDVKNSYVKENASWDKYQSGNIPKTILIQNLTVNKNRNLEIRKLSRYIFPRTDKGPTRAGHINFTPAQCLEYSVNICLHRLPPDLKKVWDTIAGRNSECPEISKLGIQSTRYDLRMRSNVYKKEQEKADYIKGLRHDNKQTECEDIARLPDSKQKYIATGQAQGELNIRQGPESTNWAAGINISKCEMSREVPKIIIEFQRASKESHLNKQSLLFEMYFNERNCFLGILESISKYDLTRKIKNKLKHFSFLLGKTIISLGKLRISDY